MNNYKDLKVWQKSVDLAVRIFEITQDFPKGELYGLTSQIRRSAVSIASNIAEGAGRNTNRDFDNFLGISYASSCELETQLIIASRAKFLESTQLASIQAEISEIQKMNWSLRKSLTKQTQD